MATQHLLSNECLEMFYYEETKIIHHIYTDKIGGECLREQLNLGVDLMQRYGAVKWLSDNSAIDGHAEADLKWTEEDWLPRAVAAGWKYWALVVPENLHARMDMWQVTRMFHDHGVHQNVFTDPDEAMAWLINAENLT